MQNKIYSLLGLAMKAGKIKSGGFLTEEAVKNKEACLVIITEDAKKNTVKTIQDKSRTGNVGVRFYGTKDELGRAIGKEHRSCLAVTDKGFAKVILEEIDRTNCGDHKEERGCNGENENQ